MLQDDTLRQQLAKKLRAIFAEIDGSREPTSLHTAPYDHQITPPLGAPLAKKFLAAPTSLRRMPKRQSDRSTGRIEIDDRLCRPPSPSSYLGAGKIGADFFGTVTVTSRRSPLLLTTLKEMAVRSSCNCFRNSLCRIRWLSIRLDNDISRNDPLLLRWTTCGDASDDRPFYIAGKVVLFTQLSGHCADFQPDTRGILRLCRARENNHENCKKTRDHSRNHLSRSHAVHLHSSSPSPQTSAACHRRMSTAPHAASAALTTSAAHDTDIATPRSPSCTCQPCAILTIWPIATTAKMIAEIAMYDFVMPPTPLPD